MYLKYHIVESIASSVSQYKSFHDQVYHYTLNFEATTQNGDHFEDTIFKV